MLHRIFSLLLMSIGCQLSAQPYIADVLVAFNAVPAQPYEQAYRSWQKGLPGGHLQGVQRIDERALFTASSGTYSYYAVSNVFGERATNLHKLLDNPYRHAGGCQAAGNVWAVGVEDNVAKNKAKVLLLSTDTNAKPITIAERSGAYERSTAGATGLVRLKDGGYLVAVGDWNSKHIDFYQSKPNNVAAFDSIATYNKDTISTWGSYQNINLIQQADGKLYLIGFCLDSKGSRADLFSLTLEGGAKLQLVASRHFKTTKGVSFRYGAGLNITDSKKMVLVACARNLKKGSNYINSWW